MDGNSAASVAAAAAAAFAGSVASATTTTAGFATAVAHLNGQARLALLQSPLFSLEKLVRAANACSSARPPARLAGWPAD